MLRGKLILIWFALVLMSLLCSGVPTIAQETIADASNQMAVSQQLQSQGRFDEAIPPALNALAILKRLNLTQRPEYAFTAFSIGILYEQKLQYAQAEPYFIQARDVYRSGPNAANPDYARCIANLALIYQMTGRYSQVEPLCKEAMAVLKTSPGENTTEYASCLNTLGLFYSQQGDFVHAEPNYVQARQIYKLILTEQSPIYQGVQINLGLFYQQMGRYDAAEATFLDSLRLAKLTTGKDSPEQERLLNTLGNLYAEMGRYKEAVSYYDQAAQIVKRTDSTQFQYAIHLGLMATILGKAGQLDHAESLALQCAETMKAARGEASREYAQSLGTLALLYATSGRMVKAEEIARRSREIAKKAAGETSPEVALSLGTLSLCYRLQGRFAEAETALREQIAIYKATGGTKSPAYAGALNDCASLCEMAGEHEKTKALLQDAWAVADADETGEIARSIAQTAAYAAINDGRYSNAERYCLDAIERLRSKNQAHRPEYAEILTFLATTYLAMGHFEKVEPLLREADALLQQTCGSDHTDYGLLMQAYGGYYLVLGNLAQSEACMKRAIRVFRKSTGTNGGPYASVMLGIASIYQAEGRPAEAEATLRQAQDHFKAAGQRDSLYAAAGDGLADIYRREGKLDKAEAAVQEALEIYRNSPGEHSFQYAAALQSLSRIQSAAGRQDLALQNLQKAKDIVARTELLGSSGTAIFGTQESRCYALQGKYGQALESISAVMKAEQDLIANEASFLSEGALLRNLSAYKQSLDYGLSYTSVQKNVKSVTQAFEWVLRRKGIVFDTVCRLRKVEHDAAADPEVSRKMAQLRSLHQRLANLALHAPEDREQHRQLHAQADNLEGNLTRLLSARAPRLKMDTVTLDAVRTQIPDGAALIEIVRYTPIAFDSRHISPEERRQPERYVAFLLRKDKLAPPQMFDLGAAEDFEKPVRGLLSEVRDDMQEFAKQVATTKVDANAEKTAEKTYKANAQLLYKRLFPSELRQALEGVRTLLIAPDGELNTLAFEALVDEKGDYLIQHYRFAYLTCGRDLLRTYAPLAKGTLIFADPNFNMPLADRQKALLRLRQDITASQRPVHHGGTGSITKGSHWEPLPGTAQEAEVIAGLLADSGDLKLLHNPFLQGEALEEVFKAIQAPRVLHISTHGFYKEEAAATDIRPPQHIMPEAAAVAGQENLIRIGMPLLHSGFVLSGANRLDETVRLDSNVDDGWVTAEEVSQMDLAGTDLVTLCACVTGRGELRSGEGVFGLRRAFLFAGARTLLTSLYETPAADSVLWMTAFYKEFKEQSQKKNADAKISATHAAQLAILQARQRARGAAHPYYWASYILVGDPR